ncbi:MAG: TIGR04255 family protein, partial [Flammeovirgaceae bacterium]
LQEFHYLHGDLYPLLKDKFPFRETTQNLPMVDLINLPTHRFRYAANDYPLVQVGPGIITINTIDSKYFWEDYEKLILEVMQVLSKLNLLRGRHNINLSLRYIDLLRFNFQKADVISYLRDNLNVRIEQAFYKNDSISNNIAVNLNYENDLGYLNVNIGQGKNANGEDGIAIQTSVMSRPVQFDEIVVKDWIGKAHELCSSSFKNMTKGSLYDSFK